MTTRILLPLPDEPRPAGGIRHAYRLVDLLRGQGYDAAVWHRTPGFRCDWFDSDTEVINGPTVELDDDHLVIVPEVLVLRGHDPAPGGRKVIWNQNPFYTFENVPSEGYPGWEGPTQLWSGSDFGTEVLGRALPDLPAETLGYWIDTDLFAAAKRPERLVAYMPRKRGRDATVVIAALARAPALAGWEFRSVHDLSERETAKLLGRARIFLALGEQEGFGLPVAEAMACECLVVGYAGGGGSDFFDGAWATRVRDGDLVAFIEGVAAAASNETDAGTDARDYILDRYNRPALDERLKHLVGRALDELPAVAVRAEHPLARFEVPASEVVDDATRVELLRERVSMLESVVDSLPRLRERVGYAEATTAAVKDELAGLRNEMTRLAEHDALSAYTHEQHLVLEGMGEALAAAEARLQVFESSTSWRLTAPLRRLVDLVHRR